MCGKIPFAGAIAGGLIAAAPARAGAQGLAGFEEQDFLFQIEESYTQEAGEWQLGVGWDRSFSPRSGAYEVEFEYGLTDRFQLRAELPFESGGGFKAGDVEAGADYALLKENQGQGFELVAGAALLAPTGTGGAGEGWGYALSLRAGKQVADGLYGHAYGACETAGDAREWAAGLGAAWRPRERVTFIAEWLWERESESEAGAAERESTSYVSGGAVFEVADDVLIGAAGAAGVSGESADARLLVQLQVEWGERRKRAGRLLE